MPEKMLSIVKAGPHAGLEMTSVDIPAIKDDEVLIKIKTASICGTDLHIYKWNPWAEQRINRLPLIIGHEFAGTVVETGRCVKGISEGDYVSADSHIVCGDCLQCRVGQQHVCRNLKILGIDRDGCFAEYVAMPVAGVWKNDAATPPEFCSVQDPLGNAFYCTLVESVTGKSVFIIGDGPIGLFSVGIARVSGASWIGISGHHALGMEVAKKMGADAAYIASDEVVSDIMERTGGNGVDVVLEMSGSQEGLDQGLSIVRKGGRFSAFGLYPEPVSIDMTNQVIFKGITLFGINGRLLFDTWHRMHNLLKSGGLNISPVITHKIPFADFERGFSLLMERPRKAIKVVMEMPH